MNLFDVYSILDIEPVKAQGCYVYDKAGHEYLDLYGGHAVISIGHSHPTYIQKLTEQLQRIGFYSNSVVIPQQKQLADLLGQASGYDDYRLFLCNSGAEANENAIKLASFHNGRKRVISICASFHGRTHGAATVTDNPAICAPVNSREHVTYIPLNDIAAAEAALDKEDACAVIIEGIQGLAGIYCPEPKYLQALRSLCDRHGSVLILDEVQSGYGRTGRFFAHQWDDVAPDLITMAKGMGNGFPVAGVLIHPKFEARKGMLGTTFGGGYLACTAAIAVLQVMQHEKLLSNALHTGTYLLEQLKSFGSRIKEVRGRGLMIAIEMDEPIADLRKRLILNDRIFTGTASNKNVLRLLPPLSLSCAQADIFLECLKNELK